MSAPLVPDLNPSAVNRDTIVEMKLSGVYTPFGGVKSWAPNTDESTMNDDTRYSDGGYNRDNKTGTKWSGVLMLAWAGTTADGTQLDPCLKYIVDNCEGGLGLASQIDVRFYEYNSTAGSPRYYARQGLALATIQVPGGAPNDNKQATVTLAGQGKLNKIAHPYPFAGAVPVVATITPGTLGTAGGTAFRILGAHFTGATTVTLGGTAATSVSILSDGELIAVSPAHSAGTALPVVVTNVTGASSGGATVIYA